MSEQLWYRNEKTGAVVQQAKEARAMLAQSEWFPLSDEDVAAREQAAADAVAADEQAMQKAVERQRAAAAAADAAVVKAEVEAEAAGAEPPAAPRKRSSIEKEPK